MNHVHHNLSLAVCRKKCVRRKASIQEINEATWTQFTPSIYQNNFIDLLEIGIAIIILGALICVSVTIWFI